MEAVVDLLTGLDRRPGRRRIHYDGCRRCSRRHVVGVEITERMRLRLPLVPRRHAPRVLGLQNGTLAVAIAVLLFGGGLAIVPAATYSLIRFATALIYIAVLRRAA